MTRSCVGYGLAISSPAPSSRPLHGAWSITLTRDPAAGWEARRWLTEAIGPRCGNVTTGSGALEEILVMASELVANVVLHTEDNPQMAVRADAHAIHVAVSDDDPHIPEMAPLAPSRVGGNGLRIVDALSDHWGVEDHPGDGKTVWFDRWLPSPR